MHRFVLLTAAFVALVSLGGCHGYARQDLRSAEGQIVVDADGHRGGRYELEIDGRAVGDLTLWAKGIVTAEHEGEGHPGSVAYFHASLESNGDQPLTLPADGIWLSLRGAGDWLSERRIPAWVDGPDEVAPGAVGDYRIGFRLPDVRDPQAIQAARLGWRVGVGADEQIQQVTPFVESIPVGSYPAYRSYHYYHYAPYHYRYRYPHHHYHGASFGLRFHHHGHW